MGDSLAARDPLHFTPAFVFDSPGGPHYAPDIPELLRAGAPRELDDDAMALFLRLGFFVDDDTPFRAIKAAVPPVPDPPRPHSLTRPQLADAFLELFRAAVHRQLPTEPYVPPLTSLDTGAASRSYHRAVATDLARRLVQSKSELLRVPSLLARCAAGALDGRATRV